MRARPVVLTFTVLALAAGPITASHAAGSGGNNTAVCAWGGTPAAPTGTFRLSPALTNTPSTGPISFVAGGDLTGGGPCQGDVTFQGQMATGATCAAQHLSGEVDGLPGVVRFDGVGVAGAVHEFMYDKSGNIVGADQPQAFTLQNTPHFTDCNTQGLTTLNFSAVVELFGAITTGSPQRSGPTVCTWGGSAADPTGTFTITPGLTDTPSTQPSAFHVTGPLAGGTGCTGTLTYNGQIDPGGTCSVNTFGGDADGIPGVTAFQGLGVGPLGPARLYDKEGSVVGSENANVTTTQNAPHFTDCSTPQGFTGGTFNSTIVLFG